MTSIIKFTPLSGALDEGPNCYLLQVDEFTFLLDCGWSENFEWDVIENIKKHLSQIDAVLLSFPDIQHIGALPYLAGTLGLNCPIYATVPVYKMGQMFLYDLYQSHHNTEEFDRFTLDHVDTAFDKIIQVKHNQTVTLRDKGEGLSITPVHAGHMIGGTAWKIVKADEEGEILYAVDFNHKRERHLNGCALVDTQGDSFSGRPPQLLITDAYNAAYIQARRKLRDEQLLTKIIETMRADGNVLIAVDTAGRVLELAILLDQLWRDTRSGLCAYSLAMINNVTYNVVEFAKSMVEWMSDKINNSFTVQRNNPFEFKHLKLCHNLGDLAHVAQPKCVLASTTDMESGFARQLFVRWCDDPRNSIIVTSRTARGTLARKLIDDPTISTLNLEIRKRVPIVGEELDQYERMRAAKKASEEKNFQEESSDESDDENATKTQVQRDYVVTAEPPKSRGGFFKQAKKTYLMFPFMEQRIKWDEYGEIINPDDYRTNEPMLLEEELHDPNLKAPKEDTKDKQEEAIEETPTKCVKEQITVEVKCSVAFIDFEGRSDGGSMLKIIQQIRPREIILVRAEPKPMKRFAEQIKKTMASNPGSTGPVQVFTPAINEVVDTTKERHIYQVKLKDSLVGMLRFSAAKDADICWLDARVDYSEVIRDTAEVLSATQIEETKEASRQAHLSLGDGVEEEEDVKMEVDAVHKTLKRGSVSRSSRSEIDVGNIDYKNSILYLEPLSIEETPGHNICFVNELRLSDFKQVLIKNGIQAEFIGGVLVCNNSVAIRRNKQGFIDVEGCLTEDYYTIRELLYQQYAIV